MSRDTRVTVITIERIIKEGSTSPKAETDKRFKSPEKKRSHVCTVTALEDYDKSFKVRDGVKTFLDKAKSRSVPLHLGAIMTFDTDSCKNNTVEAGEVEQSTDLPWSIPEDYDANNEFRLLSKNNVLLDTYEWEKFTELKSHMMKQFFYDLSEIQRVLEESSKDELSIRNMCKTDDITISYHWEYSEGLSLPMGSMIAAAVSDPIRNGDNFIKTITLQRDYRTCTFNRYDVEAIFYLKPIINYHLEIMRSSGFKEFYDNIVECVIMQKSKREEIRRIAGVNVDDFQV
ncbi:hypothetical protein FQA39_LY09162 [Lamprigera yunnana]|nr:hypothetical protein FQA39_LY09162 [Lamprigera yunnana]